MDKIRPIVDEGGEDTEEQRLLTSRPMTSSSGARAKDKGRQREIEGARHVCEPLHLFRSKPHKNYACLNVMTLYHMSRMDLLSPEPFNNAESRQITLLCPAAPRMFLVQLTPTSQEG